MRSKLNEWINYHHLYYFMKIAQLGSVSKASHFLKLGQPTLSAQLKTFEDSIGVMLFERKHKKLILTEQGQLALNYAQNIFKLGGEMQEALNDRMKPSRISLSVGALDSIPKSIMVNIAKVAYDHSPCSIHFAEGRLEYLIAELKLHKIDLIISNFLPNNESAQGLFHRKMMREEVGIYGSKKFLKLKKNFPQSLNGQPVINPTYDAQLRHDLDSWVKMNNIELDIIAETQDYALKKLLATSGMAMIPSSRFAVQSLVKEQQLFEIGTLENTYEDFYMISASRRIENPISSYLMKNFKS
ncbi:MAG: LysR family transcriptional regulator [Bacteriovoracaceae bacterium]